MPEPEGEVLSKVCSVMNDCCSSKGVNGSQANVPVLSFQPQETGIAGRDKIDSSREGRGGNKVLFEEECVSVFCEGFWSGEVVDAGVVVVVEGGCGVGGGRSAKD